MIKVDGIGKCLEFAYYITIIVYIFIIYEMRYKGERSQYQYRQEIDKIYIMH